MKINFRQWHRWMGLPAGILLLLTAFTGVWLECVRFFGEEEALREKIRDLASPHTPKAPAFALEEKLSAARLAVAARHPDVPMDKIQLQLKGAEPTATFFLGGKDGHRVVVSLLTSAITKEEAYEEDSLILRLHSGEAFGDGGMVVFMGVGVTLFALSITGLIIYWRMRPKNPTGLRRVFWLVIFSCLGATATTRADSPFYTDDPEFSPGWEIKYGFAAEHNSGGNVWTAPVLDLNYAIVPRVRLNLTLAGRMVDPTTGPTVRGLADTEFKIKWRFVDADPNSWLPSIGIAPKAFFPTSDEDRGLGDGVYRAQLPLQFGKTIGNFYTFAEAGYQVAFDKQASDLAYYGAGALYNFNSHFALGTELYGSTPIDTPENHQWLTTLGLIYTFNEHWAIKASLSRTLVGVERGGPQPSGVFYLVHNF